MNVIDEEVREDWKRAGTTRADRFDSLREREMLNRYEEERSARRLARCVIPCLSHGTFGSLEIWLRGLATNIICSSGDLRRKAGC